MSLEESIQQLIEIGEKDPIVIARKIRERNDSDWLAEQLLAYADEFIADRARQRLNSVRRSAEVALRPGDVVATAELKVTSFWVPGFGWKPAGDVTPDDLELRACMYDKLAAGAVVRATWLRQVRDLMLGEGAKTLSKLKATLPPLRDDGANDLLELVAA